ncbi:MAG: fatty acid desaturase, partial [Alphaproteobacteria bacterium]|nr:fatty acid desaturase [Alphaproteobacteria bacterium]
MQERLEPRKLKELCTKSFTPWIYDMVFDWALIVGSIALFMAYKNPLTFVLAVLVVGNRQHALTILGHDGTHFTISKNRFIN